MSESKVKGIPYGISDFEVIRKENYYYVDKTRFLKDIEQEGKYLFFIRPRRFGKSLFLSIIEPYFGLLYKDQFEELFKGTWIYSNPIDGKHGYLVLKLNFSGVDPQYLETSFVNHVRGKVDTFLYMHSSYLEPEKKEKLELDLPAMQSAADILSRLVLLCRLSGRKIYIIIDEYDNFANTILSTSGREAYENLTRGEGFFRAFFNFLKEGTTGIKAPISRLFITGVSPVTLDDVTSGFNIGKNISVKSEYNETLGFTESDVLDMIAHFRQHGRIKHDDNYLMPIIRNWYNNYVFSPNAETPLYNSDMILYFLDEYMAYGTVPEEMIDHNVRIDYGKLRHLIIVDKKGKKETNGNFSRLRQIIEEGEITSKIVKGFPLEELSTRENFTSLLFYFGLLTIAGKKEGLPLLKIPNQTVKTLFYDYIIRISKEINLLDVTVSKLDTLLHRMAYRGEWQVFFDYLSQRMKASTSIRDFFSAEKVIQGFLLAYLGISDYFIVHSEKELNKGYADITMEPFLARYEGIKYSYLIEIKYFPKPTDPKTIESKTQKLKADAEAQLNQYAGDQRFAQTIGNTTLIKLVLIFCGSQLVYSGPVTGNPSLG